MTIIYHLYRNHLPNRAGADYYQARVAYRKVVGLDGLLDLMTFRSSSITRADMLAVFEDFSLALLRLLLDGVRIVTSFGEFGLTIKGDFEGETAKFDPKRHRIELVFKPSDRMASDFKRQVKVRREETILPHPNPRHCTNLTDPEAQGYLFPGQLARVTGYHLKFDPLDSRQGIFLIPLDENGRFEPGSPTVRVSQSGYPKNRELIFLVPADLASGAYHLEVRAIFGQNTLRLGQLAQVLLVP